MGIVVATIIISYELDETDGWGMRDEEDKLREDVERYLTANTPNCTIEDVTVECDEEYMAGISG